MRKFVALVTALIMFQGPLALAVAGEEPIVANPLTPAQTLQTCTSISSHTIRILRLGSTCHVNTEALAIWRSVPTPEDLTSKFPVATVQTCAGRRTSIPSYRLIRSDCQKFQDATTWHRWLKAPSTPEIKSVEALNETTALVTLNQLSENPDAPTAFFRVVSHPDEVVTIGSPSAKNQYYVTGLNEQKTYTFTISATNADGKSSESLESKAITTPAIPQLIPAGPGLLSFITASVLLFLFFAYRRFNSALV
jgi:Fibronectin type III domain